jgi:FkbM family methyltransferase
LRANTVDLLGRYVYFFGVWEPNLTTWIARQLHEGDTFVDVGANIGYYTLLASRIVGPTGNVIAIEASPRIHSSLKRNIALNDAVNVRDINIAVTDAEGEVDLYDGPIGNSGHTSVVEQDGLRRGVTVQSKPLPAILTEKELCSSRLFKIDVEGAEWLVVDGLRDALSRTKWDAEFVIELSPERLATLGRKAADVLTMFREAGFHAYSIVNEYSSSWDLERPPL